jgi:hypothetical protein
VLYLIATMMLIIVGCEVYTTALPTVAPVPLDGSAQALALERYATQSAAEVYAIQSHQANATALAESYQATVTADQAILEQQRVSDAQQAAAAAAQAQVAAHAIVATATERAYQATATQQARDWEATVVAQQATATAQVLALEATKAQLAEEARTTATAEHAQAIQAEATRQMQQQERTLAVWRNYGIPGVLLVLLGYTMALVAYALRQYTRRTHIYQSSILQASTTPALPLEAELEFAGETPAQLTPIPPFMPSATGLRSVRILRRLNQARRAGFLSGPLLDSLEITWRRIRRKDNERENTD